MGITARIAILSGYGSGTISGGGSASALVPSFQAEGLVSVSGSGGIDANVSAMTGRGDATVSSVGQGNAAATLIKLYGSGFCGIGGRGGITAPRPIMHSTSDTGGGGIIAKHATFSGIGYGIVSGSGGISTTTAALTGINVFPSTGYGGIRSTRPTLRVFSPITTTGTNATWVLNLLTGGHSQYSNYNFNSYFRLGNAYYGCTSTAGIYVLDGAKDQALDIDVSVVTGVIDFGVNTYIQDAYLVLRSEGDMALETTVEETRISDPYDIPFNDDAGMQRRRVKLAKGQKGNTWQFKISNVDGADFTLKSLEVVPVKTTRRI